MTINAWLDLCIGFLIVYLAFKHLCIWTGR